MKSSFVFHGWSVAEFLKCLLCWVKKFVDGLEVFLMCLLKMVFADFCKQEL
jgi:hypothetical protein